MSQALEEALCIGSLNSVGKGGPLGRPFGKALWEGPLGRPFWKALKVNPMGGGPSPFFYLLNFPPPYSSPNVISISAISWQNKYMEVYFKRHQLANTIYILIILTIFLLTKFFSSLWTRMCYHKILKP